MFGFVWGCCWVDYQCLLVCGFYVILFVTNFGVLVMLFCLC